MVCRRVFISQRVSESQSDHDQKLAARLTLAFATMGRRFEMELETTIDKVNKANEEFEEKDKLHMEVNIPHPLPLY